MGRQDGKSLILLGFGSMGPAGQIGSILRMKKPAKGLT